MVKLTQINFNRDPKEWGGELYTLLSQAVSDLNAKEAVINRLQQEQIKQRAQIKQLSKAIQ